MKRIWSLLLIMVAIILVDQFSKGAVQENFFLGESKVVIDGFFNLTYVRNTGAAFGFGHNAHEWFRQVMFLFIPVLACLWLTVLLFKTRHGPWHMSLAYALILAGAIGNLIDRFMLGYVVDFFDFYIGTSHFATFNVADSSISVAAGILVLDMLFLQKRAKTNSSSSLST